MLEGFFNIFKVNISYNKEKNEIINNSKILCTNQSKVEELGKLKKKRYWIECQGDGSWKFTEINSQKDKIKKIKELEQAKKDGILTEEDYEKEKQKILDN